MITIIIPVYNGEKNIERCLKSIQEQTFIDFEAIIINDGSIDNTEYFVKRIIKNDKRFKLISLKNCGVSNARNQGLNKAKGNYVMFVDSDDWLEKNALQVLYDKMIKNKCDVVKCGYKKTYPKKSIDAKIFKTF